MDDVFVYVVDLPTGVKEAVLKCADGFTIYISGRLGSEERKEAYDHALRHIQNDDWSKADVQAIEWECHHGRDTKIW